MRLGLLLFALILCLLLGAGTLPVRADTALRCDAWDCAYIHCNWTGDRCFRVNTPPCCVNGPSFGAYIGVGYGPYLACDPWGDRCYRGFRPFWDYHEYYRHHGYIGLD